MMIFPQVGWGNNAYKSWFHLSVRSLYPSSLLMNKSLAAMNGALGSRPPLLLLFSAFRGNFLCPLRGSNSFHQMRGNLSARGVDAHPCTKQGLEKWGYTGEFSNFLPTVSVLQHVSGSSIIKRGALANSATVYYCNCMCKVLYLMLAGCVNRIKYVLLRCNRELLRRCKTMLCCVDQCSTTLWLHWILPASANLISLLSVPINSCVWHEWPVWWTRFLQDKHLLWAFVFIYNHCYH